MKKGIDLVDSLFHIWEGQFFFCTRSRWRKFLVRIDSEGQANFHAGKEQFLMKTKSILLILFSYLGGAILFLYAVTVEKVFGEN